MSLQITVDGLDQAHKPHCNNCHKCGGFQVVAVGSCNLDPANPSQITGPEAETCADFDPINWLYRGYWKTINEESEEYIMVFVSDWLKDHWALYAHIDVDNYEDDIEALNELLERMNWRDGDVYYELIDHDGSDSTEWLYTRLRKHDGMYHIIEADEWTKHINKDYDPDEDPDDYHAMRYPPYSDRFSNRWEYVDYLIDECGYTWEVIAKEFIYLAGSDSGRISYDRHAGGLF